MPSGCHVGWRKASASPAVRQLWTAGWGAGPGRQTGPAPHQRFALELDTGPNTDGGELGLKAGVRKVDEIVRLQLPLHDLGAEEEIVVELVFDADRQAVAIGIQILDRAFFPDRCGIARCRIGKGRPEGIARAQAQIGELLVIAAIAGILDVRTGEFCFRADDPGAELEIVTGEDPDRATAQVVDPGLADVVLEIGLRTAFMSDRQTRVGA
jgi:hypothetical protein